MELLSAIKDIKQQKGPILLLVKIKKNPYLDLKRPDKPPKEYKKEFMRYLSNLD